MTTYAVTGSAGYLGLTLVSRLRERGHDVRALVRERGRERVEATGARTFAGDVTAPHTLEPFLADLPVGAIVVHCASIITIATRPSAHVRAVNVDGTRHVVAAARAAGASRLVHVSSVHAMAEPEQGVITETDRFDPDLVEGDYGRTKAEATRIVLDANGPDLQTLVVQPSGIVGPGDYGNGEINTLVTRMVARRLPALVDGGYDFVDVRDVAEGIIGAAERGRPGQAYLLTGDYLPMGDAARAIADAAGLPQVTRRVPYGLAVASAPLIEWWAGLTGAKPMFTPSSVRVLRSNGHFSHAKATADFGYRARDPRESLADQTRWLLSRRTP